MSLVYLVQKKPPPPPSELEFSSSSNQKNKSKLLMFFQFDLEQNSSSPGGAAFSRPDIPGSAQFDDLKNIFTLADALHKMQVNFPSKSHHLWQHAVRILAINHTYQKKVYKPQFDSHKVGTLQMFTGKYRDVTGKSGYRDLIFAGKSLV